MNERTNLFQTVKSEVTARQVAELYGLRVTHNGMACCPFHNDRNPSMKLDERYYCFGCQATGDAVDLTAKLQNIGIKDAAIQLANDFGIAISDLKTVTKQNAKPQITHAQKILTNYQTLLLRWEADYAPLDRESDWHPLFIEALSRKDFAEYLWEGVMTGNDKSKTAFSTIYSEEVREIEQFMEQHARQNLPGNRAGTQFTGIEPEGRNRSEQAELHNSAAGRSLVERCNSL